MGPVEVEVYEGRVKVVVGYGISVEQKKPRKFTYIYTKIRKFGNSRIWQELPYHFHLSREVAMGMAGIDMTLTLNNLVFDFGSQINVNTKV
jgi:hypothetical protein